MGVCSHGEYFICEIGVGRSHIKHNGFSKAVMEIRR